MKDVAADIGIISANCLVPHGTSGITIEEIVAVQTRCGEGIVTAVSMVGHIPTSIAVERAAAEQGEALAKGSALDIPCA